MAKLNEIIERPSRHFMEDGVVEMTFGAQLFLMGAFLWFASMQHYGSFLIKVPPWLSVIPFVISGRVIKFLKERVVAPRAGYVTPREEDVEIRISSKGIKIDKATQRMLVAAAALVLWTLGLLVLIPNRIFAHLPERWHGMAAPGTALLLALWFVWIAWRQKSSRYWCLAAWSLVLGSWTLPKGGDAIDNAVLMLTCLAGGWALLGAWRLRSFLAANPRSGDTNDEN